MTVLYLTLMMSFSLALIARYYAMADLSAAIRIKPNRLMVMTTAAMLALVAGLRNNIGDTFFYMHSYVTDDYSLYSIVERKDIAFGLYQKLLKTWSDDPQLLILVTACITNLLIVMVLYKYARLFELSVFVYIASGAYVISMNGIRQFMAAAFVFAATKFILNGNAGKFLVVVLFASFFHQSALIMLPIYFFVRREAWTRMTFALLAIAIGIVYGFNEFQDILFSSLQNTQYAEYKTFNEGGANMLRVLFYAAPLFLAYLGREKLRKLYPKFDVIVNLSLIGVVLMLIATQNWIFARLAIYFTLYQIILLAWIVKAFREKDQKLVYLGILLIYFVFFYYENAVTLGIEYRSDYITWFN